MRCVAALVFLAGLSMLGRCQSDETPAPSDLSRALTSLTGHWTSLADQGRSLSKGGPWKSEPESSRYRVVKRSDTRVAFFYGKEKSAAFELESKDGLYEWFTYDKAAVGESGKGKVTRIDYEDAQNWVLEVEWDATKDAPAGFAQGVMMGRYFTWTEGQLRGGRKVVTGFSVNRRRS